ncbi:MAG: hypothetical protein J7M05_00050 [Anaerolineae bacterium]|nr:hypothetical protein [Anaerolineae bacterium]
MVNWWKERTYNEVREPRDGAALVGRLAGGGGVGLYQKRRSPSPQRQVRYLVEDLPGIGPQTADTLLRHFGTLERLFGASEEELRQVPGIGPKRARAIRELLTLPYAPEDKKEKGAGSPSPIQKDKTAHTRRS